MSDLTQVLGIVVRVDGMLELTNGMKLGATGVDGLGKALDKVTVPTQATGQAVGGLGAALGGIPAPARAATEATTAAAAAQGKAAVSAGQYSAAMRQLPAQITDVVTSLASGSPVWLVAIQQGGQIKDAFGGIGPAFRAVLSTVTPLSLALGGLAAVGGAFALAFSQGDLEAVRINKALVLSGEAAGFTRSQFDAMSRGIADSTGVAIGAVRGINEEVLKLPGLGAPAFQATGRAAAALAKLTGDSAEEAVKALRGVTTDAAAYAASANRSYNFLTAAQYAQIRSLQAQGREQEAVRRTMDLLADTMTQRQAPALGTLDRAINTVKTSWSDLVEALRSMGREQTAEERLATLRKRLDELREANEKAKAGPFNRSLVTSQSAPEIERLSAEERLLNDQVNRDAVRRTEKAIAQQVENDRILKMSSAFQDAQASIERAGADKRLAQSGVDLARRQAQTDLAFQRDEMTARAYQASLLAIEKAKLDAQETNLQRQIAIESAKRPDSELGTLAQQAALVQLEAQRLAIAQQRVKLQADEQSGNRDIAPKAYSLGPSDALRAFKAQDNANVDAYVQEQRQAREQAAQDLLQMNRQLTIDLIQDDRARGTAQIAVDAEVLRKRLDLASLNADERKRVEDDFATWRVLRERQLTEELKPEWQRMLESWADTQRLMREAHDNAMTNMLRGAEDAWIEFARTGKLNAKSMVDAVLVELARLEFRRSIAAPLSGVLNSFLSAVFGSTTGSSPTGGTGIKLGGVSAPTGGGSIYSLTGTRAAGGPVDRGRLYEVNERGPELLQQGGKTYLMMGASDGRVIPNQALGGTPGSTGAGGGVPSVQVNITNNGQPVSGKAQASRGAGGALQIDVLLDAIDDGMADRIATGRGSTYAAIGGRFGLRAAVN